MNEDKVTERISFLRSCLDKIEKHEIEMASMTDQPDFDAETFEEAWIIDSGFYRVYYDFIHTNYNTEEIQKAMTKSGNFMSSEFINEIYKLELTKSLEQLKQEICKTAFDLFWNDHEYDDLEGQNNDLLLIASDDEISAAKEISKMYDDEALANKFKQLEKWNNELDELNG